MLERVINTEMIVGLGLVIALISAIFLGMNELAMSLGSGLVGYMGGKHLPEKRKTKEGEPE